MYYLDKFKWHLSETSFVYKFLHHKDKNECIYVYNSTRFFEDTYEIYDFNVPDLFVDIDKAINKYYKHYFLKNKSL